VGLQFEAIFPRIRFCWWFPQDWWMYHANEAHTGDAAGCSDISSSTACDLVLLHKVPVTGSVITIPSIVQGKVFVGTTTSASGGTLYKIDVASGAVERAAPIPSAGGGVWGSGIGGSPAVVGGYVYISTLDGKIYCLRQSDLSQVWVTDLRNPHPARNQPVDNSIPAVGCWPSPLVVKGNVYVGVGLGEDGSGPDAAFGFVYCLEASTGNVKWLFCTNKFTGAADNSPNDIPHSLLSGPPPAPFTRNAADPPSRGASVWSSCAFDTGTNRIFVGTGNPNPDAPLPNAPYSSGVLALDADTGQFRGFFQPAPGDSYRPNDLDVDMPSSPTLFTRGGQRILAIGSKNGAFFLLDPATMGSLSRRQLLPYVNDNPATPVPAVDPGPAGGPDENHSGTYSTVAVHFGLGRLFVGIGGWGGSIDSSSTPFMRALDWNNLQDAWPNAVGGDGIRRYTVPIPPMYSTPGECGISSPAVVNDVVFVSTTRPGLYALDATSGLCLWSAPGLPGGPPDDSKAILGPAVYGNYVVVGCQSSIYIYALSRPWLRWPWWELAYRYVWPWPPPPPPDGYRFGPQEAGEGFK